MFSVQGYASRKGSLCKHRAPIRFFLWVLERGADLNNYDYDYDEWMLVWIYIDYMYDYDYDCMYYDVYDESGEYETPHTFTVGIARVPFVLLQCAADMLRNQTLPKAWMLALADKFPDISLRDLRSLCPSLLPPWLLQRFTIYDVWIYRRTHVLE